MFKWICLHTQNCHHRVTFSLHYSFSGKPALRGFNVTNAFLLPLSWEQYWLTYGICLWHHKTKVQEREFPMISQSKASRCNAGFHIFFIDATFKIPNWWSTQIVRLKIKLRANAWLAWLIFTIKINEAYKILLSSSKCFKVLINYCKTPVQWIITIITQFIDGKMKQNCSRTFCNLLRSATMSKI